MQFFISEIAHKIIGNIRIAAVDEKYKKKEKLMMQSFVQYTPTKVVFGKDTQKETGKLASELGATKVFLVYGGGSVIRSGLLDEIKKSLDEEHISYEEFGGVKPNPRLSFARKGVEKAIAFGAELILAVGGGSAIDTAKGIAIGAANPDTDIWEFWKNKKELKKALPVGTVLTISAAGSEMSNSAVLTDEETQDKSGIGSDLIRPKFAIMNPKLTYTLPKYQLTCGIVDIFMHTIERYFTPVHGNELTDEIAEGLMRTLIRNAAKAYENQEDYDAMSEIMWCGSISHNGITGLGRPKDFLCHKLGHQLGAKFDEAHGATLSAVWGSWARYVYHLDEARFANYGRKVWNIDEENDEKTAVAAIEKTEEFFRSLHMPTCLGDMKMGVQPDEVLKEMAGKATAGDTMKVGAFQKMGEKELYEIYKKANHR